ncbi:MAG: hypothetical protein WD766_11255 [Gemmatimonadota bacterium]
MSKRKQPQRLPPPIMHGDEAIDSEVVLTEVEGELGLVLWKTVRAVRLWAELPEGERSQAFEPAAHVSRLDRIQCSGAPEEIATALTKAAAVLRPRARSASVTRACLEIGEWAAAEGALGTAIEFTQAAAVASPTDARIAHEVGKLARTHAEYTRAEMWYRQAVSRARRQKDWYEFSRSYIGLGKIFLLRGSYPQARKSLIRGLRAAKRFSIRPLAAAAYHDLMVWAIHANRLAETGNYAKAALAAYGPNHRRLPGLAHDFGVFLMESGHFRSALRTFVASPCGDTPVERLARAVVIVRSAANVGERELYRSSWSEAECLLQLPDAQPAVGMALLDMARGAAAMGEMELATATGEQAREIAIERAEYAIRERAEAFLDSIHRPVAPVTERANETPRPTPQSVSGAVEAFEAVFAAAVNTPS